VDKGPWYRWAFERLEYRYERFGMRNRVERFFRYLKERTVVFHHKMGARNHMQGITKEGMFEKYLYIAFILFFVCLGLVGGVFCLLLWPVLLVLLWVVLVVILLGSLR
jgi:hypothetical protein